MTKLRALVIDPSVLMRRFVREAIELDGTMEVVAVASEGRAALDLVSQARVDFIVLEADPGDTGLVGILRDIRRIQARLPVFLLAPDSTPGATATVDLLAAGASDYVARPSDTTDRSEAVLRLATDLVPRIRAHFRKEALPRTGAGVRVPRPSEMRALRPGRVEFVCIGVSTGGPNALAELFSRWTQPLPVPMAIVQHMPANFTLMLAKRLNDASSVVGCREAREGDVFEPGCALLAPGGRHLAVVRRHDGALVARLLDTPPENSCRPAADVLFRHAVDVVGGGVLGVVMTGMGHDGLKGAERIRKAGGHVLAQDQASSIVWGMPGSVVEAGLADAVVPLSEIAAEVTKRVFGGRG